MVECLSKYHQNPSSSSFIAFGNIRSNIIYIVCKVLFNTRNELSLIFCLIGLLAIIRLLSHMAGQMEIGSIIRVSPAIFSI